MKVSGKDEKFVNNLIGDNIIESVITVFDEKEDLITQVYFMM